MAAVAVFQCLASLRVEPKTTSACLRREPLLYRLEISKRNPEPGAEARLQKFPTSSARLRKSGTSPARRHEFSMFRSSAWAEVFCLFPFSVFSRRPDGTWIVLHSFCAKIEPSGTRRYMLQVQIQITSESVLFLPLSFFTLGEYNIL